jgi:membrane protein
MGLAGLIGPEARAGVTAELSALLGPEAGRAVDLVVERSREESAGGGVARVVGIAMLVVSAGAVFGELQSSLNRIWEVRAKPGRGVVHWLEKRLFSLGLVLAFVFLLSVSLGISTALAYVFRGAEDLLWQAVSAVVSFVTFALLFAVLFKYVPDVRIPWRVVRVGAITTSLLFLVGKTAVGLYLGESAVGSAYGAAGTLLVLLVWVYYAAIVFLLGAEATQAHAEVTGTWLVASVHAEPAGDAAVVLPCPDAADARASETAHPPHP